MVRATFLSVVKETERLPDADRLDCLADGFSELLAGGDVEGAAEVANLAIAMYGNWTTSEAEQLRTRIEDEDGFADAEQILAEFTGRGWSRERLTEAREEIGAECLQDRTTGRWFVALR